MQGGMGIGNKIRVFMAAGAVLFLAVLCAGSYMQADHEKEIMEGLSFECTLEGQSLSFSLWKNAGSDTYYLFLPAAFSGKDMEFTLRYADGRGRLEIDGASYRNGDIFREKGQEQIHSIRIKGLAFMMDRHLQVLVSENLPALMITAEDEKDLLKTEEFANKKYLETGDMMMVDERGKVVCRESLAKFKVRGNLTATLDKKPLTFSFHQPVGLCGMAPAVKWNLLANATDGSYIRNKIVLDLANESIDAYEPDGEFTELYLNGRYQGLYLLTEAVEIGENRLNILPEDSWFLEMELDFRQESDGVYVTTDRGQLFGIHVDGEIGESEKQRISDKLNDIESALFSENGIGALSGKTLSELIDLESWAEAFLIQEISGDHDTGIASQFAYAADREAPLFAGPVWDFDGTMGNVNTVMFRNPAALTASIEESRPHGNPNQNRWLSAMYRNKEFKAAVEEKYIGIFREKLEGVLNGKIDGYMEQIGRSAALDAFRWHEKRLEWMFVLPEGLETPNEGDYHQFAQLESHVDVVKKFLEGKKDFLDKLWIEHRDFCTVEVKNESPVLNQDYNQTMYFWVERGTPLSEISQYEEINGIRFYYADISTGELVTDSTRIWSDCILTGIPDQE